MVPIPARPATSRFSHRLGVLVTRRRSGILFVLVFGLASTTSAQSPQTLVWITGGLGVGSAGAAGQIAGTVDYRGNLFTARASTVSELFGDDFWDVGLMYGRSLRGSRSYASLSVGGGIAGGTSSSGFLGTTTAPKAHRFTVPLELRVAWRPLTFLGLGASGIASLNRGGSFGGLVLEVEVGKVR